ncbi:hypothetical protein, partial [Pseudomonas aeruginosa]
LAGLHGGAVSLAKAVEFEGDGVDLGLDARQLSFDCVRVVVAQATTQRGGQHKGVRGFFDGVQGAPERPSFT